MTPSPRPHSILPTCRTRAGWSRVWLFLGLGAAAALASCKHTVKVEPIKFEPIDITLHIYLQADQKLDSFFEDVTPAARGAPATTTTPTTPAGEPEAADGGAS